MIKLITIWAKFKHLVAIFLVSLLGGVSGGLLVKSSIETEQTPVRIELYNYDKDLSKIAMQRDSVRNSIPSRADAWDYIFDRYDTGGRIPKPY